MTNPNQSIEAKAIETDLDATQSLGEALANAMAPVEEPVAGGPRLELDADKVRNGLGQLVLTLIQLLHDLLEKQALRRIDDGKLSDQQIEDIGLTLQAQVREIERLKKEFGLEGEELNLDLGDLGRLL